MPITSSREFN